MSWSPPGSTWREIAAAEVQKALQTVSNRYDQREVRAVLREAYPFGERAHYPYKVWLEECRKAIGRPLAKPRSRPDPQMSLLESV